MPRTCIAAALLAALGVFAPATQAAPVFFLLGDHPGGLLYDDTDPDTAYGLRLDHLDATYSAGNNLGGNGGPLYLTYDPDDLAAGARIFGTIDRNTEPGDGVNFDVEYFLFGLSAFGEGFRASGGNGSITAIAPCTVDCSYELLGKQDLDGWAFIWDNDGSKLPDAPGTGWVGEGWVQGRWPGFNDWLVTGVPSPPPPGEEIPEPGTISLMLIGLGMLAGGRKLRNLRRE